VKRFKYLTLVMLLSSLACQLTDTTGQVQTQVAATLQAGQPVSTQNSATLEPSSTPIPPTATPIPPTKTPARNYKNLTVGYVEGCHSGAWGSVYTSSIIDSAKQLGVKLKYTNSYCNLNAHLMAFRDLINAKVDVIGFSAVWSGTKADWENLVNKASEANIPVIIVDQMGEAYSSAYTSYIKLDYMEQGRIAARALTKEMNEKGNIVLIPGSEGSSASDDRINGFREVIQEYPNIKIIDTMNGDWSTSGGNAAMTRFMKDEGDQINGAFFANDDMALGGIQAIKAANKKPGVDIKIVSVDGTRAAFLAMIAGDLNATVETNPYFGPQFFEAALKAANGEPLPREIIVQSTVYFQDNAKELLPTRKW
jgi:simple sugar transport system substrate-binding protein